MPVRTLDADQLRFEILIPRLPQPSTLAIRRAMNRAQRQYGVTDEAAGHISQWLAEKMTPRYQDTEEYRWIAANAPDTVLTPRDRPRFRDGYFIVDARFMDKSKALQFKLTF